MRNVLVVFLLVLMCLPLFGQTVVRRPIVAAAGCGSLTFDTASSNNATGANSVSWNHTTSANSNRAIIFCVGSFHSGGGQSVSSITYNGSSTGVTSVGSHVEPGSGEERVDIYKLVAPASGTNAIVVTMTGCSAACELGAGSLSFYNAAQTTLTGTFASADGNGASGTMGGNVSSAVGEIAVDVVVYFTTSTKATVGAGMTERFNIPGNNTQDSAAGSTAAGATTVTFTWTDPFTTSNWSWGGVGVKPCP